ncbi:MAG TPA: aminotransferase class III-fold pyridoxal phosphate-dependent enzyme [Chitinolyticbacter sp.]|nr:aminotransferase class III-fold pyridoxal phosphate-dependent enzyme [Chitinolyticbacter sp.]
MSEQYSQYVKPKLAQVLRAIGLDVCYERAQGNYLYYRDGAGQEREVLDFLGGYGALMLGHNPPAIVEAAQRLLAAQVPVHAQFSLRGRSGTLAARLSQIAVRETGSDEGYITTFANSGAEAVEAAIKHAELARMLKLEVLLEEITSHIETVREAIRRGEVAIPVDLYERTDVRDQVFDVRNFDDLIVTLINHNSQQLAKRPVFVCLEKSFHGKLAASVQLTYNKNFRRAFQFLGLKVRFVPMGDTEALARIAEEEAASVFDLAIVDGQVALVRRTLPLFTAFLAEPIQGEGGIHAITPEYAREIRRFCNQQQCPLVLDEIQSGMGRTGRFFAASQVGLRGDYYTLSKSLGGGIAKIAALLIRRELYEPDFGLIHSSTFAEDDFSAGIAEAVLDVLEAGDGALYAQAESRGARLLHGLSDLQQAYPDVIRAVRGRGLFIGIEFCPRTDSPSQILRSTDYADSLGYFIAGYMLRVEGIRLAPTGSAPNVLRLEPSVHIGDGEIDRLFAALDRVCRILRHEDTLHFVHLLCSPDRPVPRSEIRDFRQPRIELAKPAPVAGPVRKVAFINHLIGPEWLRQVDPALADLSDGELRRFVLNMAVNKKSAPYAPVRIRSPLGPAVEFMLYPLCVVSEQMGDWLGRGALDEIRDDVADRIRAAREDGCELAGLGMYTSIVTNNCTALDIPEIGLTSGNALTVAMAVQAVDRAIAEQGKNWGECTLAVVGAAGNIASTYAMMLAERTTCLQLIGSGNEGSAQRLNKTAQAIYESVWDNLVAGQTQGLAGRLAEEPLVLDWLRNGAPERQRGRQLQEAVIQRYGRDPFLPVASSLRGVAEAEVVLCAANAPLPFLDAALFRQGAVVCDVAVPHNVHAHTLAARPDLTYLQGGVVATPHGESLDPGARAFLGAGQLYACMAETAVLGLSGHRGHYSHGAITPQQVKHIAALAQMHGFGLAEFKRGRSL